jgi:hypothetical protein
MVVPATKEEGEGVHIDAGEIPKRTFTTLYSLLYLETALHVSGGTSAHHQELQVAVRV